MAISVNLEDRIIIVAGIGPGLGLTLTEYLLQECYAKVVALSKNSEIETKMREQMSSDSLDIYHVDLTDEAQTQEVFTAIEKDYPKGIQGLVNNAYVPLVIDDVSEVPQITKADFRDVFENNVYSAFRATQLAVPLMLKSEPIDVEGTPVRGTIVTLGSIVSQGVSPYKPFYGPSKAALAAVSHTFAHWYGKDGIISICVEPGDLTTPRTEEYIQKTGREKRLEKYLERTALRRSGSTQELARIVAMCLDPLSAFMTGSVITADGGYGSRF